jgi:hypothetical protein
VLYPAVRLSGPWRAGKHAGGANTHPSSLNPDPEADGRSHRGSSYRFAHCSPYAESAARHGHTDTGPPARHADPGAGSY